MKKILVAIDLARSTGNNICIETAQNIAGIMDGTIILLHIIETIPRYAVPSMPVGALEKLRPVAEEELRQLAEQHNCDNMVVREGRPALRILEYASEINADLIVLNSHDPGLADYFFGSVASRVARHAHCSVYVVRHPDDKIQEE